MDESVTLLPPFYVDYGKHIKIGKGCFIQQCCTFFGRGGITLGEHVLVGPKVNIITINHDSDPENRSATYGRPVVIEDKVWIGINATILPGCWGRHGAGRTWEANRVGGDGVTLRNSDGWSQADCPDVPCLFRRLLRVRI